MDSLSLVDQAGNSYSMALTNSVDVRICYELSSSSFTYVQNCPGLSTSNSNGRTYSSGLVEYGYYGAAPQNLDNKVIMFDAGYVYLDGNTDNSWNGSTVLVTGSYNSQDSAQVWSTSPYGARFTLTTQSGFQQQSMITAMQKELRLDTTDGTTLCQISRTQQFLDWHLS